VRHPRQARHHHAQGRAAGAPHPRRARVSVLRSNLLRKQQSQKTTGVI